MPKSLFALVRPATVGGLPLQSKADTCTHELPSYSTGPARTKHHYLLHENNLGIECHNYIKTVTCSPAQW